MNPIEQHNFSHKNKWDIPENTISSEGVLDYIELIKKYIRRLKNESWIIINTPEFVEKNYELSTGIMLFIMTDHEIIEIGLDNFSKKYEGMNKPKMIVHKSKTNTYNLNITSYLKNGKRRLDNDYRATYRLLILKLRNKNNIFRSWNDIKKLLLHELVHTMANHLMFYNEDNHMKDFDKFHNYLKKIDKSL